MFLVAGVIDRGPEHIKNARIDVRAYGFFEFSVELVRTSRLER